MKKVLFKIAKYVVSASICIAGGFISGMVAGKIEQAFDEVIEEDM